MTELDTETVQRLARRGTKERRHFRRKEKRRKERHYREARR